MKTFEQCCDETAQKEGFKDWNHFTNSNLNLYSGNIKVRVKLAAELYVQSARAEAWEEGRVSGHKEVNPYKS
jgi:hypothetical protein